MLVTPIVASIAISDDRYAETIDSDVISVDLPSEGAGVPAVNAIRLSMIWFLLPVRPIYLLQLLIYLLQLLI